jgi:nitrite reductase/ring-hydroxylating ferredoxin subunit
MARQLVTHVGAIASGAVVAFDVVDRRIAVANVGGVFFAFDDACTHRHCSLAKGRLSGTTVTCLCHGSEFDVRTGAVLKPPATQAVRSYPITIENGGVNIDI